MRMNKTWDELSLGERIILSAWMATREHLAAVAADEQANHRLHPDAEARSLLRGRFDDLCYPVSAFTQADYDDTGMDSDGWLAVAIGPDAEESPDDNDASFREGAD